MEPNSLLKLSTIIRNPTIYTPILSCLSHLELARMAKVCRVTRDTTEHYQKAAFNINTFLSPFFDAIAFRSLQARTQTLIGGSFAFYFLERSHPPLSMDLLVFPAHCEEVGRWLLENGYYFVPFEAGNSFDSTIAHAMSNTQDHSDSPVIRDVLIFRKTQSNAPSPIVSVIVATNNPLEIVFNACATCFFSLISWRRAYCVFPRATFHNRRALLLDTQDGPLDLAQAPEIAAYMEKNGLAVQKILDPSEYLFSRGCSSFPLGSRFMMDSSSLSIELDVTNIAQQSTIRDNASSSPMNDVVSACGFRLRGDLAGKYWVEYNLILAPALKYSCIMAQNELLYQLTRELQARSLGVTVSWLDDDLARLCGELSCHLANREREVLPYLDDIVDNPEEGETNEDNWRVFSGA